MTKTCSECPTSISGRGKTGKCRPCSQKQRNSRPEIRAKVALAMRAKWLDSDFRKERTAQVRAAVQENMRDPDYAAKIRAAGMKSGFAIRQPTFTPEMIAARGRRISAAKMAHVPSGYHTMYRQLGRQRVPMAERLEMIAEQMRADAERAPRLIREREAAAVARHERQKQEAY